MKEITLAKLLKNCMEGRMECWSDAVAGKHVQVTVRKVHSNGKVSKSLQQYYVTK